jgi:hypothetical protein
VAIGDRLQANTLAAVESKAETPQVREQASGPELQDTTLSSIPSKY